MLNDPVRAPGVPVGAFDVEPPEGVSDQGDEPEADEPPASKRRPKK
jgi:hypothetical protein